MNAAPRYGASLALVLALHGGVLWLILQNRPPPPLLPVAPDAVLLDLPPAPVAPPIEPTPPLPTVEPPPPPVIEAPPPPPPVVPPDVPLPPVPLPPVLLPRPAPPPRPVVRKAPPRVAPAPPQTPAAIPSPEPQPRPPPAAPPSDALPAWRGEVSARLQQAKRYPNSARLRGEQGVATVSFTVDRSGHVISAELVRSSGTPALDAEAVALIHRAEPLPPLPADLPSVTLTVPISFSLN